MSGEPLRNVSQEAPRGDSEEAADFTVRVARDRSELAAAYELVYRRYLAKGYLGARPSGIVYQPSFGLSTSRTLVASVENRGIIGTMTLVGDNAIGLKLEEIYHSEVESLRIEGRSFAEVTCLCIDEESEVSGNKVFAALTKFAIHHSYLRGYDDLLLAIHPRHYRIYWHTFRAYPIGPCQPYALVGGNPALCCRINLHNLDANMTEKVRECYFEEVKPREHYDGPQVSQADHEEFCRLLAIPTDISDNGQGGLKRQAA